MNGKEAIERLKGLLEMGECCNQDVSIEGKDMQALDLGIKAIEINQKRLELIEKYVLTRDMFEYASANYRYWYDLIDALEACEDD